jgi:beta-ketodecanoyl-[acyl-carrier-protein] synthase
MPTIVITGTGLFTPAESVSNEALVESFNTFVQRYNDAHASEIEAGECEALAPSSAAFIEAASGIRRRYVVDREGILDPERMVPRLRERSDEEPGVLCEMSVHAAREALEAAGRTPADVDCVIAACSNLERAYPAVAIEVQDALGCGGYAYDMNVACSSATFGIQNAANALQAGSARCVLLVNPEVCTGHLDFRDRDSHFIFGDACTAVVLERSDDAVADERWEILGTRLSTQFSNNIRNDFGFLNRTSGSRADSGGDGGGRLFHQQGRKVFKEVVPMVAALITDHLDQLGLAAADVSRFWLHQANLAMNQLIARRVLGRDSDEKEAPVILDEFANTSSAGSVICFHRHRADLGSGDVGILCSFGAGYSAGSVALRKH